MLVLVRFADHAEMGVFGELYHDGEFVAYTVEKPWRHNEPFSSCVPDGLYSLEHHESNKFGETVALVNAGLNVYHHEFQRSHKHDRYAILIHAGNTEADVVGCIAIGERLGFVGGKWAVLNSRAAMGQARDLLRSHSMLEIVWKHRN